MKLKRKEKIEKIRRKNILRLISPVLVSLLILLLFLSPTNALTLTNIPNYSIEENQTLTFNIQTSNYNNTVIFSVEPVKGTLTKINDSLATFEWAPAIGENGTYSMTFSAADNSESVSKQSTITVTKLNNPPIILNTATGPQTIAQVTFSLETDRACICKYSMSNRNYAQMEYTLAQTNAEKTQHEGKTPSLSQGASTIYVLCNDENGNYMTSAGQIMLNINSKPSASIELTPESPLREGTIKIELTTSEPLIDTPELKYSFDDDPTLRNIALIGSGTNWEGYLIIKDGENERVGSFSFKSYDLTNLEGTDITAGKLFLVDTLNPEALQSITIENLDDKIKLAWEKPNSEEVGKYKVYKKSGTGGVEEVDYYDSTSDEVFYDKDVEYNTGYYYRVSVVDKAGNEGPMSKEVFTTHVPVLNSNVINQISNIETPQKLDSKLEYILNTELQKVDNIQKDIAKAEETISRTLGSDNIDSIDTLNVLSIIADNKNKISSLRSSLEALRTQALEESNFDSIVSDTMNQIDTILKETPMEVKVLDSSSYQEFTNDEKTNSLVSAYLKEYYPNLSTKKVTSKIEEAKKLQDVVIVNVKLIKGEIKYPEETKPFAIVEKTFTSDQELGKILLFESIPENIAAISSIKFSEQPFYKDDYAFWNVDNINGKKLNYVLYSELNIADLKNVKSVVLNEQDLINKTDNLITGDSIDIPKLNSTAESHSGLFLAMIVAGILIICGLFGYYIYWSEAEPKEKKEEKVKDVKEQESKPGRFSVATALFKRRKSILPDDSHRKISIEKPDSSVHSHIDTVEFTRVETLQPAVNPEMESTNEINIEKEAEKDAGEKESAPQMEALEALQEKLANLKKNTKVDDLEEFDVLRTKTYEIKRLCDELEEQSVIDFTNKTRAHLEKSLLYIARHVPPVSPLKDISKSNNDAQSGSYNDRLKENEKPKEPIKRPETAEEDWAKEAADASNARINTNNFSQKAPEGREFVFPDGGRVSTIKGLKEKIIDSGNLFFNEHVTDSKNDFANWIGDIFQDYDLAYKIRSMKTREELINLLNNF